METSSSARGGKRNSDPKATRKSTTVMMSLRPMRTHRRLGKIIILMGGTGSKGKLTVIFGVGEIIMGISCKGTSREACAGFGKQ